MRWAHFAKQINVTGSLFEGIKIKEICESAFCSKKFKKFEPPCSLSEKEKIASPLSKCQQRLRVWLSVCFRTQSILKSEFMKYFKNWQFLLHYCNQCHTFRSKFNILKYVKPCIQGTRVIWGFVNFETVHLWELNLGIYQFRITNYLTKFPHLRFYCYKYYF